MDIPPIPLVFRAGAPKRFRPLGSLLLAAILLTTSSAARAADETSSSQGTAAPLALAPAMPPPTNPAFAVGPTPHAEQSSIFGRWWFWTAVGAAVAATVIIVVVSSRGQAPPSTDLGNQGFQP